jgi:hypothetical protein
MVHGSYYGVQYEIFLKKQVDFFDDILPIWMSVRKRIELEGINKGNARETLIVIPYEDFDRRFAKLDNAYKYISAVNKLTYNKPVVKRKHDYESFKYTDVLIYKSLIKHNKNLPEPISIEELEELEEEYKDVGDLYKEVGDFEKLDIQRIISRPEYFEEIKQIEKSLTDITLSNEEKELINSVLSHPKLNGIIEFHGINLIEGLY